MKRELISTDKALKPIRPYYSQAVKVSAAGTQIYVAGQTWDPKLGGATKGDAAAQAEFALENMKAVLEAAGATMEDVVKVTVYVRNMEDLDKIAQARYKYFSKSPPSSTIVEVSKLYHPDILVEIDAIAVI
jgi:2-iminobutanoate/2-iminopropanoate deaminase